MDTAAHINNTENRNFFISKLVLFVICIRNLTSSDDGMTCHDNMLCGFALQRYAFFYKQKKKEERKTLLTALVPHFSFFFHHHIALHVRVVKKQESYRKRGDGNNKNKVRARDSSKIFLIFCYFFIVSFSKREKSCIFVAQIAQPTTR